MPCPYIVPAHTHTWLVARRAPICCLQVDVFTLTLPNVGDLKSVVIGHDDCNPGADWHLNMVEVLCVNTGQYCRFYYNAWLAKNEPPYQLEVGLGDGEGEARK